MKLKSIKTKPKWQQWNGTLSFFLLSSLFSLLSLENLKQKQNGKENLIHSIHAHIHAAAAAQQQKQRHDVVYCGIFFSLHLFNWCGKIVKNWRLVECSIKQKLNRGMKQHITQYDIHILEVCASVYGFRMKNMRRQESSKIISNALCLLINRFNSWRL